MALLNRGVNIGHSSRLGYDNQTYEDYLSESVSPLLYKLNPNQINNCSACLSVFGPRTGHNGYGNSTTVGHRTSPAQDLVDVESVLSNRNVIASKSKDGKVNDINVNQFQLQHARICNSFLDPISTHLTNPPQMYRGLSIDRFYNLGCNPQNVIFDNFSVNTNLEAKDNYFERIPHPISDRSLPHELQGRNRMPTINTHNPCNGKSNIGCN